MRLCLNGVQARERFGGASHVSRLEPLIVRRIQFAEREVLVEIAQGRVQAVALREQIIKRFGAAPRKNLASPCTNKRIREGGENKN